MKRARSFSPGFLVIEFLSITFAVFLGFMLTEWRTSRANTDLADGALKAIASEVAFNENQYATRTAYYRRVLAEFDSLKAAGQVIQIDSLKEWQGAAPPLLRNASYEAALNTGALAHVSFETANALATAYAVHEYVLTLINAVMGNFMAPESMDPNTVEFTFSVFLDMEPEILGAFREVGSAYLSDYGYVSTPDK